MTPLVLNWGICVCCLFFCKYFESQFLNLFPNRSFTLMMLMPESWLQCPLLLSEFNCFHSPLCVFCPQLYKEIVEAQTNYPPNWDKNFALACERLLRSGHRGYSPHSLLTCSIHHFSLYLEKEPSDAQAPAIRSAIGHLLQERDRLHPGKRKHPWGRPAGAALEPSWSSRLLLLSWFHRGSLVVKLKPLPNWTNTKIQSSHFVEQRLSTRGPRPGSSPQNSPIWSVSGFQNKHLIIVLEKNNILILFYLSVRRWPVVEFVRGWIKTNVLLQLMDVYIHSAQSVFNLLHSHILVFFFFSVADYLASVATFVLFFSHVTIVKQRLKGTQSEGRNGGL